MAGHSRLALAALVIASGACVSAPNPFIREAAPPVSEIERGDGRCPVVLTNATGLQVTAGVVRRGSEEPLGFVSNGQSVHFEVACARGDLEAVAEAASGGFERRYRKLIALAPAGSTRLTLRESDRIR